MPEHCRNSRMLAPTPGEREHDSIFRSFAYFMAVFGLGSLGRVFFSSVAGLIFPAMSTEARQLVNLFATVTALMAAILWGHLFERRSLASLGFSRRRAVLDYLVGTAGGILLLGAAVGLCVLAGVCKVTVTEPPPSWGLLGLFLAAFLIQGMSEEVLCRSLLMVSLSRRWPLWASAVANAAAFALLHLFNAGITLLALLNIFLFGLLASVLALKLGSIWLVSALHSLWNFAQGNLFGIPVSGITPGPSPLTATMASDTVWQRLIGGGDFGIEGGLAATGVLVVGILIAWWLPARKSAMTA